jgi:hypothetical protein
MRIVVGMIWAILTLLPATSYGAAKKDPTVGQPGQQPYNERGRQCQAWVNSMAPKGQRSRDGRNRDQLWADCLAGRR